MKTTQFERSTRVKTSAKELREWHFAEGAFEKLTPPWEKADLVESPGKLTDGCVAIIEIGFGPFKQRWVAEHEITTDGFIDRQIKGPFAYWEHQHKFIPTGANQSRLVDSINYRIPFGLVGRVFGSAIVNRKLDRMFRYRHEVTRSLLEQANSNKTDCIQSVD